MLRYTQAEKFTHKPTGESVVLTSAEIRTAKQRHKMALKILKARIVGRAYPASIIDYELPDDMPYPNELSEYRKG